MPKPLDLSLLLAQTLVFVDEGEQAWRRIRDRGDAIVVEPTDADELQAKFAAARAALETVEAVVARREEVVRGVFRAQVGGFGALASALATMAGAASEPAAHDLYISLADCVLNMGRAAAIGAMGADAAPAPEPEPPKPSARWRPEVVQGGAA